MKIQSAHNNYQYGEKHDYFAVYFEMIYLNS